jgi:exodeoxyribonuclease VII small subunit
MARDRKPEVNDAPEAASPSFEEAIERLQRVVEELEGGSLSLEESIARYEEGVRLSRRLTQTLDRAEKRIERLSEDADGDPVIEPMVLEGDPAVAVKPAPRPAREPAQSERREPGGPVGELPF